MANYDNEILIRNIRKLMENSKITQSALADILGMSQSDVSKALNPSDKRNFTLDQVAGIAKHFNVSIDFLLGIREETNYDLSPKAIAEFFVHLIEHGDVNIIKHPVEEKIYEPYLDEMEGRYDYRYYKKTVSYNAFYFPSFWQIPDGLGYEEQNELYMEATECGNEAIHRQTNRFFHQFLQIFDIYKQKGLEEDTYRTVVNDLLSHLSEESLPFFTHA